MGDAAVVFDGVWKKFRKGERHDSLRDLIPSAIGRIFRPRRTDELQDQEFWAVQNLSFAVNRGEALGIIGPNGAGKSTTLKLLTKILRPTRGRAEVRGRVGALIEVAAGFHPDLTGRENVFLQGSIMGMSQRDVARRFDEIVDFAGVASFIDTPVKRYSSGMSARLGFSIAAHLEPDAFIVDEVLSVGDISFQARCIACMKERLAQGMALVFVSHNLQAVAALCNRTVVLGRGQQVFAGKTEAALEAYARTAQTASTRNGTQDPALELVSVTQQAAGGQSMNALEPHTRCRVQATLRCLRDAGPFSIGIEVERTRDLFYCYGVTTEELGDPLITARQGDIFTVDLDFTAHFSRGHYRINLHVRDPRQNRFLLVAENAASLTVCENLSYDGVVEIQPAMTVRRVEAAREELVRV